jgi:hypothetical protein
VIAEAVASGYSVIVLFVSSKSLLSRLVVILDVVINELLFHGFFQKKKFLLRLYIYIYIYIYIYLFIKKNKKN